MAIFPPEYGPLIELLASRAGTTITLRQELGGGKSGAYIALVDAGGSVSGVHILKVGRGFPGEEPEPSRHRSAESMGAFGGALPHLLYDVEEGDTYALLQEIAGGSTIQWRPLMEELVLWEDTYQKLVDAIWQQHLQTLDDGLRSAFDLLAAWLPYQLSSADGGRIRDNLTQAFGAPLANASHFVHLNRVLPNPFPFATQRYEGETIRPILGPQHGDLHPQNVLVRAHRGSGIESLYVIDFAQWRESRPVFFDVAYFELSTLLRALEQLGEERWFRLVDALAAAWPEASLHLQPEEQGWARALIQGRKRLYNSAQATYPNRSDDLLLQFLLAQVAAGLTFLHKPRRTSESGSFGLTADQHLKSLIWSATFLRQYIKASRLELPSSGEAPIVGAIPTASTFPERTWSATGGFDDNGLNILLLPPQWSALGAHVELILARSWTLVLDFEPHPQVGAPDPFGSSKSTRQAWPGSDLPTPLFLRRGLLWYFANGRDQIEGATPATSSKDWRRSYFQQLQRVLGLARRTDKARKTRLLVLGDGLELSLLRLLIETIDSVFGQDLAPVVLAASSPHDDIDIDIEVAGCSLAALAEKIELAQDPQPTALAGEFATLPARHSEGGTEVLPADASFISSLERDMTVVYPQRAHIFPRDRRFAIDFRRGRTIEWAELAQHLDVDRVAMSDFEAEVRHHLETSRNATINLWHEPSSGGTTLSRRLAWNLKEDYPTVILEQLSEDTGDLLWQLSQKCRLPILIIMESEAVTETGRESLLRQLRDSHVRAVFVWVSRLYREDNRIRLRGILSEEEAEFFLEAYLEQVTDSSRRSRLVELTRFPSDAKERSPFFYGLTAFGTAFLGLDRLVEAIATSADEKQARIIAHLALASAYSSDGFPSSDYDLICAERLAEGRPIPESSPFALDSGTFIKVPHRLIAIKFLERIAREPQEWMADLHIHARHLIDDVARVRHRASDNLKRMTEILFVTRDTEAVLARDEDSETSRYDRVGKFSPLIAAVGNAQQARSLLKRLHNVWPEEPHYAVHYIRHLLYELPEDVEEALKVADLVENSEIGSRDGSVIHTAGMAYRAQMNSILRRAEREELRLEDVEEEAWDYYHRALSRFEISLALQPDSEYGHVSALQASFSFLEGCRKVSGESDLAKFLAPPPRRRYVDVFTAAEEQVASLRNRPSISNVAARAIARWDLVCGKIDRVVSQLRVLAHRQEDSGIRRALIGALYAKHRRSWRNLPAADLRTVVIFAERNISQQGVRDWDVRRWLQAYRYTNTYDAMVVVERMVDWHRLRPGAVEPTFYLFVFNVILWLNSGRSNSDFAREANRWLQLCRVNRPGGVKTWSYEWLQRVESTYRVTHFTELEIEPVAIIRRGGQEEELTRQGLIKLNGIFVEYRGPQSGRLDLGDGVKVHFTPLDRIKKDYLGRRVSVFASFSYDGLVGWDPQLV